MTGTGPLRAAPSLAQIVAALEVTYTPAGVMIWLDHVDVDDLDAAAAEVRRIGDADPDDVRIDWDIR